MDSQYRITFKKNSRVISCHALISLNLFSPVRDPEYY